MTHSILIIFALIPIPVIYLIYNKYFRIKPNYLSHVEYYCYGIFLGAVIMLIGPFLLKIFPYNNSIATGFISAALLEKGGSFLLLTMLLVLRKKSFMIINSVISAMLMGLGFATLENILYALSGTTSTIFIRLLSSVPIHVFTMGLMGYYLSMVKLSGLRLNKYLFFIKALTIPLFFHGLYDTFLLKGINYTYLAAPLIVFLLFIINFLLAKIQTYPLEIDLQKNNYHFEDWNALQQDPQFEAWILQSMGSKKISHEPFFNFTINFKKIALLIFVVIIVILLQLFQSNIINGLSLQISYYESKMLFTYLPLVYLTILLSSDIINPKYFIFGIIRIPIIIDVHYKDYLTDDINIAYSLNSYNCLIKTVEPIPINKELKIQFSFNNYISPEITGKVIWNHHKLELGENGTIIRLSKSNLKFNFFLIKYYIYKIFKGTQFIMHMPGFKLIRRLFVRPDSIMHDEWNYSKGHILFHQDQRGNEFFLIKKGEIDIIKTTEKGENITLTTMKEGEIVGEMSIVGDQPRLATAVCKTDCILAKAEADNLDILIDNNPEFTKLLIKTFANRLLNSENRMTELIDKTKM